MGSNILILIGELISGALNDEEQRHLERDMINQLTTFIPSMEAEDKAFNVFIPYSGCPSLVMLRTPQTGTLRRNSSKCKINVCLKPA